MPCPQILPSELGQSRSPASSPSPAGNLPFTKDAYFFLEAQRVPILHQVQLSSSTFRKCLIGPVAKRMSPRKWKDMTSTPDRNEEVLQEKKSVLPEPADSERGRQRVPF